MSALRPDCRTGSDSASTFCRIRSLSRRFSARSPATIVKVGVAVALACGATAASTASATTTASASALPGGPACAVAPAAGDTTVTVASGGLQRTALVHVPAGLLEGQAVPLLLALHGAYGNGAFMQSYSGFSALADSDGFVVAYPSAAGRYWNIGEDKGEPDDVAFLAALITQLESGVCIDKTQVFAAGVSNGGGMAALLGCALSTTVAGVASVAGDYDTLPPCHAKRPVSLLEIHGTADRISPYFGKRGHTSASGLPPFVSAWAGRDGCARVPASSRIAPRTIAFTYRRCRAGAIVEHIRIAGGAHQWPGATPPDPGPPPTISAAAAAWGFFSAIAAAHGPGGGGAPV
jgi:polyhydroxybutyrate depolymerase